jgi:prepilin-type N-terminal cleavage/methylation domain-containing protein
MSARHPRQQHGFTLIEVLVALVSGLVVIGAAFAILEISLHQSVRIADRVEADQIGRTAMTKIIDELQSACLAREVTPVQAGSKGTAMYFRAAYSEKSLIGTSEAYEHKIEWTGTPPPKAKAGSLIDYTAKSNGGSWPAFTFEKLPVKGTLIAENVYETEIETKGEKVGVPIFQYYKYNTKASSSGEAGLSTLTAVVPPEAGFGEEAVKSVSSVLVSFTTAPTSKNLSLGRPIALSNQVTFAFSTPASEATIVDGPCQ